MATNIESLNLDPGQREAVELMQIFIRVYGRGDGTGLFCGVTRYAVLEARTRLAATQSRTPLEFASRLMRSMQWPVPPSKEDAAIFDALSTECAAPMLATLMRDTAAIVMLARHTLREERDDKRMLEMLEQGELISSGAVL